jgi:hypothetical protein
MTNGGTQGVAQHFVKYHTDLNVRIRALKVLPGADKNLNQVVPLTKEQWSTILDTLNRAVARGNKLLTGAAKENIDMMFTKLIVHEDLPDNSWLFLPLLRLLRDPSAVWGS